MQTECDGRSAGFVYVVQIAAVVEAWGTARHAALTSTRVKYFLTLLSCLLTISKKVHDAIFTAEIFAIQDIIPGKQIYFPASQIGHKSFLSDKQSKYLVRVIKESLCINKG